MTYPEFPDGFDSDDTETGVEVPVTAPAPPIAAPWSWSANTLLWVAGGVVALSFGVWFLMSFTKAKAAESEAGNDAAE